MKVIVIRSFSGVHGSYAASDEPRDVPAAIANEYIACGFMRAVKAPAKRKTTKKVSKDS